MARSFYPLPESFRQKAGLFQTILLMLPVAVVLTPSISELFFDVMKGVSGFVRYMLSSGPFDMGHAGFALDQPTIGKWLFWFTVEAIITLPYMAIVGWVGDRSRRATQIAYVAGVAFVCAILLCTLMLPGKWLYQYMHDMGPTLRRQLGLIYVVYAAMLVLAYFAYFVRRPTKQLLDTH